MKHADEPLRGTGRTTAGILEAIAYALRNPDRWVPFTDHHGTNAYHEQERAKDIQHAAQALGLTIDVAGKRRILLRSPIASLKKEHEAQQRKTNQHDATN